MSRKLRILAVLFLASVACSPEASKQYLKPGLEKQKVSEIPNNTEEFASPKVDILFVVDDSGSMQTHQNNVAQNIGLFTSKFINNSILDYQIGVITTSERDQGVLVGDTKIVTKTTPDADLILKKNINVGTGGDYTEKTFTPLMQAIDVRNLDGENKGFFRPKAYLVIILITDAEDQSDIQANYTFRNLIMFKNNESKKLLGYGAIVPSGVTGCPRDGGEEPKKIELFLGLVRNGIKHDNIFSLCTPDFGDRLAGIAKDIIRNVDLVLRLDRRPDINSIHVMFGKTEIPKDSQKGWMFDASENAVVLGPEVDLTSQPPGTKLEVHYEIIKEDDSDLDKQ